MKRKKYRLESWPFIPGRGFHLLPWDQVPEGFGYIGNDGECWEFQPKEPDVGPPDLRVRIEFTEEAHAYFKANP